MRERAHRVDGLKEKLDDVVAEHVDLTPAAVGARAAVLVAVPHEVVGGVGHAQVNLPAVPRLAQGSEEEAVFGSVARGAA